MPQLLPSELVLVQLVLQSVSPAVVHASPHTPDAHVGVPVPDVGPGQLPHVPPPAPHSVIDWLEKGTHPAAPQQPLGHELLLHATHCPSWQMSPAVVPHGCPSFTDARFVHCGPEEQDSVPDWHVLPLGVHCDCGEQARQLPAPSQTLGLAPGHVVPAEALVC